MLLRLNVWGADNDVLSLIIMWSGPSSTSALMCLGFGLKVPAPIRWLMTLVLIVRSIDVPVRKLFPSLVLLLHSSADVLYNSSSHLLAASSPGPCLPSSKDSILREF